MIWPLNHSKIKREILHRLESKGQSFHSDCVKLRHTRIAAQLIKKYGDFDVVIEEWKVAVDYIWDGYGGGVPPPEGLGYYAGESHYDSERGGPVEYRYDFSVIAPTSHK